MLGVDGRLFGVDGPLASLFRACFSFDLWPSLVSFDGVGESLSQCLLGRHFEFPPGGKSVVGFLVPRTAK